MAIQPTAAVTAAAAAATAGLFLPAAERRESLSSPMRTKILNLILALFCCGAASAQIITNSIQATNLPPTLSYFGLAGVQGGIDQYSTNYTMYANAKTSGCYGDGIHDDTAILQALVAACPNQEYVYCPTGMYLITGTLNHSGVNNFDGLQHMYSMVIRGDGPTNTIIMGNVNGEIISYTAWNYGIAMGLNLGAISAGNTRGSSNITFNVPTFLNVGQWMWIQHQTNADGSFWPPSGDANPFFYSYNPTSSQLVKVTAISGTGSGQNCSFWPPLNEGFTGDNVQIATSPPLHCGIENLSVVRLNYYANDNINISCGCECWIRNVYDSQARSGHIYLHYCGGCQVEECYVDNPFPFEDGATGGGNSDYGITFGYYSSSCLAVNNIALHCRHSFIMETGGGQDNVTIYNYGHDNINQNFFTTDYQMDTDYHGGEQRFCLFEGNVVPILRADGIEGATKHNIWFRNLVTRDGIPDVNIVVNAIDLQRGNYFDFFIENVYAPTNSVNSAGAFNNPVNYASSAGGYRIGSIQDTYPYDPNVFTNNTFLGNYDMSANLVDGSTNGVIYWTSSVPTTFPSSLFYTNKPSWFGTNVWPPFGKDVAGYTNAIPAQTLAATMAAFATTPSDGWLLTLNVTNGTISHPGTNTYFSSAIIQVVATAADTNHVFLGYNISGSTLGNPTNSPVNYFTMPKGGVTLTAFFPTNGTGGSSYPFPGGILKVIGFGADAATVH
jgi:pectate lyase-like protein/List-Bact-rpt repeat protein